MILEFKERLKSQAILIYGLKNGCKATQRRGAYAGHEQYDLLKLRRKHRHEHIAYCLLLGTERSLIEKPAEGNEADEKLIKEIYDENVRASSQRS
jgi:hypothetical protein